MKSPRKKAFTLIELMVVITIIAILVGILLPTVGSLFISAEKAQARAEVQALEIAIRKFYDETNTFPPGLTEDSGGANPPVSESVVKYLGGENTRKRIYLEYRAASLKAGQYVDPWGNAYRASVDLNEDGQNGAGRVQRKVLVWSGGPDGNPATGADNVATW